MVYPNSGGRSLTEIIIAVVFTGFLTGFVTVLCIGNYYRAKIAMERQRQRRLERYSLAGGGGGIDSSPKSQHSSGTSGGSTRTSDGGSYTGLGENHIVNNRNESQHLFLSPPPDIPRRRPYTDPGSHDLLLFQDHEPIQQQQQQSRRPNVMRV